MAWDPVWDEVFRTAEWGRYPPEELIRFVARNFSHVPDRRRVRILEIGCGTGANLWFLAREGFDAYGLDGSTVALSQAERRLQQEGCMAHLQRGDAVMLCELYGETRFDAVIDVACLQHNEMRAVRTILQGALTVLKPHGRIFSMVAATESHGDGLGKAIEPGTFTEIPIGRFQGKGVCHFFTLDEVSGLVASLSGLHIEYSSRSMNDRSEWDNRWVVDGVKA